MKLVKNTIVFDTEPWDDPGDYPSNAGGYPLPSYEYYVVDGQIIFEAENEKDEEDFECFHDWIYDYVDIPEDCEVNWRSQTKGSVITIWPEIS